MLGRTWWPARALALILVLSLTLAVAAQEGGANKKKKKGKEAADPPRTTLTMNQLRSLFAQWDRNKDDFLDKNELAIAFRGPGARAYDWREAKDKDSDLKADEEKKDEKKADEKKADEGKKDEKPSKTPDYSKYPDYQFLTQLDKDRDEQISRDEFLEWAREYAIALRDQKEANEQAAKLQQQINKAKPNSKNRKTLEAKLRDQQRQINKLQQQLKRYQNIQKKLR